MIRATIVAAKLRWAFVGVLLTTAAFAQNGPPDVPAGDARITGRVVHRAEPERGIAGVEVALYALTEEGLPGLRVATSDPDGSFQFDAISSSARIAYFVGARVGGVPFPGARVTFGAGEAEARVTVPISPIRSEASTVIVPTVNVRLDWRGQELLVSQVVSLRHGYDETLFVAPDQREGREPFVSIPLPEGEAQVEFPFGVAPEGIVQGEEALAFFGPIHPGDDQELRFGYTLRPRDERVSLSLPIPADAGRVELLVPASGPAVDTSLREDGSAEVGERSYRRFSANAVDLGPEARVVAHFGLPKASHDASRLRLSSAQWVIDVDVARLALREEYAIEVDGTEPVVAESDEPLVRLALPDDAEALRFGSDTSGVELTPHPDGGLGVLGPLPPGQTTLSLRYTVPVAAAETVLSRNVASHVGLLAVYVTDDGRTRATSERLHRRRPVRSSDRNYIHLEGFEIEEDERVAVSIAALAPRLSLPRPAFLAGLGVATLAIGWLVSAPLLRREGSLTPDVESAAERERLSLLASLRDLEHDFETGKISAADHERLRSVLRRRALAARAAGEAEEAEGVDNAEPSCPSCDAIPSPSARYCEQCGTSLS